MLQTFWLEGYKIAARSKSQALQALEVLKRTGTKPDYKAPLGTSNSTNSVPYAACYANNQGCA